MAGKYKLQVTVKGNYSSGSDTITITVNPPDNESKQPAKEDSPPPWMNEKNDAEDAIADDKRESTYSFIAYTSLLP